MKLIRRESRQAVSILSMYPTERSPVGYWLRLILAAPFEIYPWDKGPFEIVDGWARGEYSRVRMVPGSKSREIEIAVGN